jgi:hypothetical protein
MLSKGDSSMALSRQGIGDTERLDFVELSLLLPSWQVFALDELARTKGTQIGPYLRQLIGDWLAEQLAPPHRSFSKSPKLH